MPETLLAPDELADLIDAPEFGALPFAERKAAFEQGVQDGSAWMRQNGGWTPETWKGYGEAVGALRQRVGDSESIGETAGRYAGVVGQTLKDTAAAAGTVALDLGVVDPSTSLANPKLKAPLGEVLPALGRGTVKALDAGGALLAQSLTQRNEAVESHLAAMKKELDEGTFPFEKQGLDDWLQKHSDELEPKQAAWYHTAETLGDGEADDVERAWAKANSVATPRNATLMAQYMQTRDPAVWDRLTSEVLRAPQSAKIQTAEQKQERDSGLGRFLETNFGEGAGRMITEAGDPFEWIGSLVPIVKGAKIVKKAGTIGSKAADVAKGVGAEMLSEQASLTADDPNATWQQRVQTAKDTFAGALGLTAAGAAVGALTEIKGNQPQTPGDVVAPDVNAETAPPVSPSAVTVSPIESELVTGPPAMALPAAEPTILPSSPGTVASPNTPMPGASDVAGLATGSGDRIPVAAPTQWGDDLPPSASVTPPASPVPTPAAAAEAPVALSSTDAGSTPAAGASSSPWLDPNVVAIANENVNAWRATVGLPPIVSRGAESEAQWQAEGMAAMQADPAVAVKLIDKINNTGYEAKPFETAILIHHEAGLRRQMGAALDAYLAATDPADKAAAKTVLDDTEAAVNVAARAYRDTGTDSAINLRARQMFIEQDSDLGTMLKTYAAKADTPLTETEYQVVKAHHESLTKAQAAVDKVEADAQAEQGKADVDSVLPALKAEAVTTPRVAVKQGVQAKVQSRVANAKAAAAASIRRILEQRKTQSALAAAKADGLPDHTDGTGIIPTMQANNQLLPEPTAAPEWAWYRALEAAAKTSPLKQQTANAAAARGESLDDPKVLLAWLNQNVFAEPGVEVDKLDVTAGNFGMAAADFGDALIAEIQGRVQAKEGGGIDEQMAREEQAALDAEMDDEGVSLEDGGGFKNLDVSGRTAGFLNADIINEGANLIARGVRDFAAWSKAMVQKFGAAIREFLDAVWEMVRNEARLMTTNKGSINPNAPGPKKSALQKNLETMMVGQVSDGMTNTAEMVAAIEEEFGPGVFKGLNAAAMADHARAVYAQILAREAEGETPAGRIKSAKERAANADGLDLGMVRQLALAHIALKPNITADELTAAVHGDLAGIVPDLTEREVRDAMTGYGKTKKQSADEIKKTLRELNAQNQLISKIEDATAGQSPLKSGLLRDKKSAPVRELQAKLNDVMRQNGIATTGPEQLANARTAVINRIKNQIEEATRIINGKSRPRGKTEGMKYDAEMNALARERDELRAYVADLTGPSEAGLWNQRAERAAKASAEFYKRRIATGDLAARGKPVSHPATAATLAAKAEAKSAREEFDRLREAAGLPQAEAMDRLLGRTLKRQRELKQIIAAGGGPVLGPQQGPRPTTAEIEAAKAENARLQTVLGILEERNRVKKPRTPANDTARAMAAEKSAERAIEQIEAELAGKERRQGPAKLVPDAKLRALRAELESLRGIRDALREAKEPRRDPKAVALEHLKKATWRQTAEYERKLREGDFSKRTPRQLTLDAATKQAKFNLSKAKEAWMKEKFNRELAGRPLIKKLIGGVADTLNTARAMMTSVDLSAVFRQGGFIALAHPVRAAKSVLPMLRAFASEKAQFDVAQEIAARDNAPLYKASGLYLADAGEMSLSKMEEAYMSRWIQKMPALLGGGIVRGSQRAYTTFLNKLRADSFDAMAGALSANGQPTIEEAKAVANFINVATGRGKIGFAEQAAVGLNTVFFAPRYVASRFNLLGLQPFFAGTLETRKAIAGEYARFMVGAGIVYAFAALAKDDDDEMPLVVADPRSSDFGKIRFGETRIDPLSGLLQNTVLLNRMASGETVDGRGRPAPLRENMRPLDWLREDPLGGRPRYGAATSFEVLTRFARSKFSPAFASAVNLMDGENMIGEPATVGSEAVNMVVPLSIREIDDVMRDQGVPRGTALSLLNLLGMGLAVHDQERRH